MKRVLSTYLFVKRKLTPALVGEIAASGVNAVELFCGRSHFDYRSGDAVRELGLRAAATTISPCMPCMRRPSAISDRGATAACPFPSAIPIAPGASRLWTRSSGRSIWPRTCRFPILVQHLGSSRDPNDPRLFEAAFNSLEHLRIFAKQRGVTIALENTPGELATPANLRQFLADTRLTDLRLCFDIGHAHLGDGVAKSFETMRDLIVTAHIHDNHGLKDEHLAPYEASADDGKPTGASGTIDWKAALQELKSIPLVFELKEQPGWAEPTPGLGVSRRGAQSVRSRRRGIRRGARGGVTRAHRHD